MNKLFPFLGFALIGFICACSKNSVAPQKQSAIVGTWQLKTQYIGTYINDAFQNGTTGTTSGKSDMSIMFDSNGVYNVDAVFGRYGRVALGTSSAPGFTGNYSVDKGVFTMSPFLVGSMWLDTVFSPSKAIVVSNKIVSQKATILDSTATLLTINTEVVVQQLVDSKPRTITTKTRYEYGR